MASYRDKINQKKMETESGKIAFYIEELERDYKKVSEAKKHTIKLFDNYALSREGILSWCVYRVTDAEDCYKIVPTDCGYEECRSILEAQSWRYL